MNDLNDLRQAIAAVEKASRPLTSKDIEFLIWALGFLEGKVGEIPDCPPGRSATIRRRCHEIWPKLSAML